MDLYRYEVATGYRQKFAVVRDFGDSGIVSPDGLKIFLGGRHNSIMEMPDPKWEALWLTDEDILSQFGTRWFADSSGIATMKLNATYSLIVEFFGENGWTKKFDMEEKNGMCPLPLMPWVKGTFFIFLRQKVIQREEWERQNITSSVARLKIKIWLAKQWVNMVSGKIVLFPAGFYPMGILFSILI